MKKTLLTIMVVGASALTVFSQARINFNNLENFYSNGQGDVRLDLVQPRDPGTAPHLPGAYVGSDYSVQLLWKAGTFGDLASFLAASPSSSAPVAFYGATGGGPFSDGAGVFDGGTVPLGGPAGVYTFLVQAWYNGGVYGTYAAAESAFKNVGRSILFTSNATISPTPPTTTTFPSFTLWAVPEPSALALGGLGVAALFLLRRRS